VSLVPLGKDIVAIGSVPDYSTRAGSMRI
jgi:hypothetical protein